ncbi:HAD-IC family P-type ATPase [Turneriella parva]|uniref:ATPase, P-type (Transporting), HAD superfamily, subfamily IC n=1 Tax=Turneriella parva (strain ATCC BAA-1111 / DSM 21527 / NCTC 11395 / H) TaxID=869212 RepID=I4B777_TURPD|nr:HAD-IC family P-type ATPase [Turneriella parva]AFM13134.1 ATPase, P-type (transporting), HAD superfamily, subfamily IC [Turneriella parva DSM 21527]
MLREHLNAENIRFALKGSVENAISTLIEANAGADLGLVRDAFANARRAPYMSAEHGVLIPHVRVHGLRRTIAALGLSREGLEHAGGKVHVVLVLALPAGETAHELQLLQGMSSVLPAIAGELREITDAAAVLKALKRGEEHAKPSFRNLTQQQIEFELATDLKAGLTTREAGARLAEFGGNVVRRGRRIPWYIKLARNFFSFFAVLLWGAAALCYVPGVDMPQLGTAILIVVIVNGFFSFLQEYKSDKAVDALKRMMARTSRVMRDGAVTEISAEELVPGDIILLEEGDIVPADSRLVDAYDVEVDNSSLTGESTSAKRYKSDQPVLIEGRFLWIELPNIVFAGSTLIRGNGRAVVYATGMSTEIGKIADLTLGIKSEASPLQKQLRGTVFAIALLALTIGLTFLFLGWLVAGLSFVQAFVFFIGLFVANVPEGLLPTVTLSLAMGVTRMARRNAIVKNLSSVETLGCTTVIGTDKTGTLTQNLMMVQQVVAGGETFFVEGHGYEPQGKFTLNGSEVAREQLAGHSVFKALVDCAYICNNAKLERVPGGTRVIGDPTEGCLQTLAARAGVAGTHQRIHLNPFESVRKRMSVVVLEPQTRKRIAYAKGAPLEILSCCSHIMTAGGASRLDDRERDKIRRQTDELAAQGYRMLGLAMRSDDALQSITAFDVANTESDLIFLGLVAISDPVRPGVKEAIAACHRAGIRIMMITGDYPLTAKSIARQIGLGDGGDLTVLTGTELGNLSDEKLCEVLKSGEAVFARVSPEQKLRIVTMLKSLGEIVAVTGDGVNDGPALKKADIGIAMGMRGTDVAKEAAEIILTDDNFSSIVAAIEEGRGIFDNIRKFASYVFNSNPQELYPFILWMLIPGYPLVMTVMGVLAVDVGTDLIPAMGLGIEPPEKGIMERPPRKRGERLLSMPFILRSYLVQGSLLAFSCFATYYYFAWTMGYLKGPNALMNLPASPEKLNMANATQIYLQSLTAFFFPTIAVQIGNVLCKRSHSASLFSRDFLRESTRAAGIAALRSYLPKRRTLNINIQYRFEEAHHDDTHRAFFAQFLQLVSFPLRVLYMRLANYTLPLRRKVFVPLLRLTAAFFERYPVVYNFVSNPLINVGIAVQFLLCYAFFYTDLGKVYFFEPVPWHVYLFAFHGTVLIIAFEEIKKYYRRRGHKLEFLG